MKFSTLLIAAGLLCISVHITAQPGPRKKVGVVLSGGGAKGMAHIGALKGYRRSGYPYRLCGRNQYGINYRRTLLHRLYSRTDWIAWFAGRTGLFC